MIHFPEARSFDGTDSPAEPVYAAGLPASSHETGYDPVFMVPFTLQVPDHTSSSIDPVSDVVPSCQVHRIHHKIPHHVLPYTVLSCACQNL